MNLRFAVPAKADVQVRSVTRSAAEPVAAAQKSVFPRTVLPEYLDVYVISSDRNAHSAFRFLDRFLPERQESAEEYEIPQYSNPSEAVLKTDKEIVGYCCENKNVDYRIYWRNSTDSKPEHAMVFFLRDGSVIYGLSTDASAPEYAKTLLSKLKTELNTNYGYIVWESSPDADTFEDFLAEAEKHNAD
jgi:hypothetical protein